MDDKKKNQKDLLTKLAANSSLLDIQEYIKRVVEIREFNEPIQETMLLLLEEVGELAKALRKSHTSMTVDMNKLDSYGDIEGEVADIFFVLVSICNTLNIDLLKALKNKEEENLLRVWGKP